MRDRYRFLVRIGAGKDLNISSKAVSLAVARTWPAAVERIGL